MSEKIQSGGGGGSYSDPVHRGGGGGGGSGRMYLIWSEEHGAWWLSSSNGYTRSLAKAGRYSRKEAEDIVEAANEFVAEGTFNEVAIPDPMP